MKSIYRATSIIISKELVAFEAWLIDQVDMIATGRPLEAPKRRQNESPGIQTSGKLFKYVSKSRI